MPLYESARTKPKWWFGGRRKFQGSCGGGFCNSCMRCQGCWKHPFCGIARLLSNGAEVRAPCCSLRAAEGQSETVTMTEAGENLKLYHPMGKTEVVYHLDSEPDV